MWIFICYIHYAVVYIYIIGLLYRLSIGLDGLDLDICTYSKVFCCANSSFLLVFHASHLHLYVSVVYHAGERERRKKIFFLCILSINIIVRLYQGILE